LREKRTAYEKGSTAGGELEDDVLEAGRAVGEGVGEGRDVNEGGLILGRAIGGGHCVVWWRKEGVNT